MLNKSYLRLVAHSNGLLCMYVCACACVSGYFVLCMYTMDDCDELRMASSVQLLVSCRPMEGNCASSVIFILHLCLVCEVEEHIAERTPCNERFVMVN